MHLLNVGQGEAVLMDFPDGSFGLIDGGPRADAAGVIEHVEQRVTAGRAFRLAGISQWDADHIRGIPAILSRFHPQEFRYPGVDLQLMEEVVRQTEGQTAKTLASVVRASIEALPRETVSHFIAPNPIPDLGDIEMHVLAPMPSTEAEIRHSLLNASSMPPILKRFRNSTSVVLWIWAWGRVLFLSGEAEGDQFRAIDAYFRRSVGALVPYRDDHAADWIKLSHHGAQANNPTDLFKLFAKANLVASASAGGAYDHPHPIALRRAHVDFGARVLCTNLGKGCHRLLTEKGLDPRSPEQWTPGLSAYANPQARCYGTITITVTENGQCSATTQLRQRRCPYGGPATGACGW